MNKTSRDIESGIADTIDELLRVSIEKAIADGGTIDDERLWRTLRDAMLANVLKNLAARQGFRLEVMR